MQSTASTAEVLIRLPDEQDVQGPASKGSYSLPDTPFQHESTSVYSIASMNGERVSSESSPSTVDETIVPFVPSKLYGMARWALDTADFYGEKLAFFFGITSPRYSYEINRYNRMVKEEARERLSPSASGEIDWDKSHTSTVSMSSGVGSSIVDSTDGLSNAHSGSSKY